MPSPSPILHYAAAGALLLGGPAVGIYVARLGRQEAARREQKRDHENERAALMQARDLEQLKREARAEGVDVDAVVRGYRALRDGQITPETVLDLARRRDDEES